MRIAVVAASFAVVVAAGCAGAPPPNGEGEGEGEGATAGEGEGASQYPAAHDPAPTVENFGGPTLTSPRVQAVYFSGDSQEQAIDAFLPELQSSGYWSQVTSEYGIGDLSIGAAIDLGVAPPQNATANSIIGQFAQVVPNPDEGTIYLFVIPQSTTFSDDGNCCEAFDGFHDQETVGSHNFAAAYVCGCAGSDGPQFSATDELAITISHELAEAATDPFNNPGFGGVDDDHVAWEIETEGEIGDMCEFLDDVAVDVQGASLPVQRIWSNAAAAADQDPCLPAPDGEVYFNSVPVLSDRANVVDSYGDTVTTNVKKIGVGRTGIVDVRLFSSGPTSGPWTVAAFDGAELNGNQPALEFSWDKTEGQNGDVLHLTIKVDSIDPTTGGDVFVIDSTLGDFSTISMGMITQ